MRPAAGCLACLCLVTAIAVVWARETSAASLISSNSGAGGSASMPSMFSRKGIKAAEQAGGEKSPEAAPSQAPEAGGEPAKPARIKTATPANAEAVLRSALASLNTGMTEVVIRASDWDQGEKSRERNAERSGTSSKFRRGSTADGSQGSRAAGGASSWAYSGSNGPDRWAKLSPEFRLCGSGQMQSPIDIWSNEAVRLPHGQTSFAYEVVGIKQSAYPVGQLKILVQAGGVLNANGIPYFFESIEFRLPGEGRLDGAAPVMSVYLHHRSAEGKHAIVSVPVVLGASPNPAFERIWSLVQGAGSEAMSLNPKDLLPADRGHYHYMGSLTHPPCTEGVAWFVMREPIELSRPQFMAYARAFAPNARPVQRRGKGVQVSVAP